MLSSIFYTAFGIIIGSLLIFAAVIGSVVIRLDFALVTPLYIDNPQTSAIDLLRESRDLMRGNRLRYFVLELSFIPIMLARSCCLLCRTALGRSIYADDAS